MTNRRPGLLDRVVYDTMTRSPAMQREPLVFGLTVLGVVVGLAILLAAEATDAGETMIVLGGLIALVAVGGLTGLVGALDG